MKFVYSNIFTILKFMKKSGKIIIVEVHCSICDYILISSFFVPKLKFSIISHLAHMSVLIYYFKFKCNMSLYSENFFSRFQKMTVR